MKNLIKTNLYRLVKNSYYIGGCILALAVTLFFVIVKPESHIAAMDNTEVMILISGAIAFFFAVFAGLFFSCEYSEGIIRNKLIAGYSQFEIYLSNFITLVIASVGMILMWTIAGLIGGARINATLIKYIVIIFFYNVAQDAILTALCFRFTNMVLAIVSCVVLFQFEFNSTLFGGALISNLTGVPYKTMVVFYNLVPTCQYFSYTRLADDTTRVSLGVGILLSLIVTGVAFLAGAMELKNRDLK